MFEVTYTIDLEDDSILEVMLAEFTGQQWEGRDEAYVPLEVLEHAPKKNPVANRSILLHDSVAGYALFEGLRKRLKK